MPASCPDEEDAMTNEQIRLSPFKLEGKAMVDIRWWKDTAKGPRPTKRFVAIPQHMVTRLISGLQQFHARHNSDAAREPAAVEG
jgi:hypothetical protein